MVQLINRENYNAYPILLKSMHADRKRVFVDIMKWDVPHDAYGEKDEFDDEFAEYLIVHDQNTGDHLASMRLLRTDRPHLLGNVFSHLCEDGVPTGPDVREVTRLCMSPRLRARDRLAARNMLIRSMVEYALLTGIRAFTGVADMGWLAQILSAGWDCRPLGLPQMIEGSLVGALIIHIEPNTLRLFVDSWRCTAPTLSVLEFDTRLAA